MKKASVPAQHSFTSKLERIASEANYFAVSVPAKISQALQTRGPVPVRAEVNGSTPFIVSLFPVGGGRHYLRVKAEVRSEVKIKEGDRVRVKFTVRDRAAEVSLPKDVAAALRAEGVLEAFKSLPNGKKSFILRQIEAAAKPETRKKRIEGAVGVAHQKRESKS